ncbi:MAG TPA: PepSY-associated TM helix domain-containing protein [Longimicrobiaceae bacterium]|nr:PepSY-associated TM helix domain-containing protein [Longimicrobiaceae bacterium]
MRRIIRLVHTYVGLALSLLFLVFAVTGGALVYKEAYWRLVYPELRVPALELDADFHAAAIAAAKEHFGENVLSVKMPEPGVGGYHLYLDGGEAFLSAVDHHLIDSWQPSERVMSFLFDLHAHLMAGDVGERIGGVIGLLGVFLSVTGLILWWPTRRRFALRHLLPRDLSVRSLLLWHRDLGVVTSPILLVLLLTGSGLVFYATAQTLLNGAFGDPVPTAPAPILNPSTPLELPTAAMIARVEAAFPEGRIVFYYPPRAGVTFHEFRLKQPCELHPNGRSYVYLDAAGNLLQKTDACALPPGERAVHAFYPLHAGKADSAVYKLAVFIAAVALAIIAMSGVVTYLRRLRSS